MSPGAARRRRAGRTVRPVSGEGVSVLRLAWKLFFGRGLALSYKEREGTVRCAGCGSLPCRAAPRRGSPARAGGSSGTAGRAGGSASLPSPQATLLSVATARAGAHAWAGQKNGPRPMGLGWHREAGAGGRMGGRRGGRQRPARSVALRGHPERAKVGRRRDSAALLERGASPRLAAGLAGG